MEWIRQWSAIVMMMEQSFDPSQRLRYQANYSILMEDGKSKALLLKTRLKVWIPLFVIGKTRSGRGAILEAGNFECGEETIQR